MRALAADVAERAEREGALYRTIGIKVVQPPFDVNTRAESLPGPVEDADLLESTALDLLEEFEEASVRKLGVRVSNLSFTEDDQASLTGFDGTSGSTASDQSATGDEGGVVDGDDSEAADDDGLSADDHDQNATVERSDADTAEDQSTDEDGQLSLRKYE